jgi:hypothetical protein
MAARSETISMPKKASEDESTPAIIRQQRPTHDRFLLQVDRQTKASFATLEAAETAGLAIKTTYPIVQVSVYDAVEHGSKAIAGKPAA